MQNEEYINELKRCIEFHECEAERLRKRLSSMYGQQEGVFSEELRHQLKLIE